MPNVMERGDERVGPAGQGRGNTDATGPSWYDCRRLAQDLERLFGRRVGILLGPGDPNAGWLGPLVHVRAYLSVGAFTASDTWWASSSFGGASGYRTLAAAVHDALRKLWEVGEGQGMFSDI